MKKLLLAAVAACALGAPAHAIPVFDASNYAQNILTAARTLETINNQVRQLQNEARHLASLPTSVLGALQRTLGRSQALIGQAQGVAFDVTRATAAFRSAYPSDYAGLNRGGLAALAKARFDNSLESLRTATEVQAEVAASLDDDSTTLADLVGRSQGATGALQATQATNQLIALQAQQSIQTQRLLLTQARAQALRDADAVSASAQARETRRRLLVPGAPSRAPAPVTLFRNGRAGS